MLLARYLSAFNFNARSNSTIASCFKEPFCECGSIATSFVRASNQVVIIGCRVGSISNNAVTRIGCARFVTFRLMTPRIRCSNERSNFNSSNFARFVTSVSTVKAPERSCTCVSSNFYTSYQILSCNITCSYTNKKYCKNRE